MSGADDVRSAVLDRLVPSGLARRPHRTGYLNSGAAGPDMPARGGDALNHSLAFAGLIAPPPARLPAADINLLPPGVDAVWPADNQDWAPVCVAYAATACLELARYRKYPSQPMRRLSMSFFYYAMRQWVGTKPDGWNDGAVKFDQAKWALETQGICAANLCNISDADVPSGSAIAAAAANKIVGSVVPPGFQTCARDGISRVWLLYNELAAGRPVGAGFQVFATPNRSDNWTDSHSGTIVYPATACPADGSSPAYEHGHAVCVVGFQSDPSEPMGGYFVFRNSHGIGFPDNGPLAGLPRGYGRMAASDVGRFCWELWLLTNANLQ